MAQPLDKVFTVTHIKSHIPLVLDMQKMNYDAWRELFESHCYSFGVYGHLDGTSTPANANDTIWKERDGIVKMWIYGTISSSLLDTILKTRSSARDIWLSIENLFRDNKEARAIQLDNELRSLTIGDLSVHDYCQKLKTLSDLLANVDSPVTDRVVVMHMLNGLSEKFDNIVNIIKHRQPFPSFSIARSMLVEEERRLSKQVRTGATTSATSSSANVLYASSHVHNSGSRDNNHRDGHNSGSRDYSGYRDNTNTRGRGRGRGGSGRGRGRHSWPQSYWPLNPRNWQTHQPWFTAPTPYPHWPQQHWMPQSPMAHISTTHPAAGVLGHSPQSPALPAQPTQLPADLAAAFGTMTMQDPNDASWYMDTGATSHLTSQPGTLRSISSLSSAPSVIVGNGSSVPTKAIGYSSLPSKSRPLHLNNILVCPSIIKNLISVRQFTIDNFVTVEFDPFGFCVKDYPSRLPLLRCDSSGPLYSVHSPPSANFRSSPPQAMLTTVPNTLLWHCRLGHLGNTTLQSLISSRLINSSKFDMPLCHACQLGKHTRLPCLDLSSVQHQWE
ncbi:PREDICTED: uncharacterized protein LOC104748855 [Camelina sativa]|uniref:Uncharacterized protein LOC104748855 n=1 Tax=Camelina sativa TaxID=90675 RepID=A0ABM0WBP2_CAMSA|nr:PREDICTED: uncharacterized protein LOC104748855 [Camelina sativa]